ncbi:hypothetical protein U728_1238 [Clostridium botulinum 202F]|nr:hypothetical protein U728_1238 [Clostridium botulinum 202F]KON13674.1 hypothetical protein ACP50_06320 [Clostridium botulinum]
MTVIGLFLLLKIGDELNMNKFYKRFLEMNNLELGLKTFIVLLIYFGSIFAFYLKFIYRSI